MHQHSSMIATVDFLSTRHNEEVRHIMTNTDELKKRIALSGYRIAFIAERLGISYQAFNNKANNVTEFKASEIKTLVHFLQLSEEDVQKIFFLG